MHFFRFKHQHSTPCRSTVGIDQDDIAPVTPRRTYEPSPTTSQPNLQSTVWRLLPFTEKVSKEVSIYL